MGRSTRIKDRSRTVRLSSRRLSQFLLPALVALILTGLAAQSPEAALAEAQRLRRSGDAPAALETLERAAADFPASPLILFNLGAVLAEQGRHHEAVDALRAGLDLEPSHAQARLTLAKALLQDHQYADALAEVDRYATLSGPLLQGFDGHYVRGLALRRLDRPAEAEAELRRAVGINPGHVDALFNLGVVLEQLGGAAEATAYLRKAASLQPENPDIRYRLAKLLLAIGESEAANAELAAFQEIRRRTQRDSRVSVLMRQAEQSMGGGNPEQAKQLYQQVIRQDPRNAEAHANLGVAYEALGRGDLAEAMFRKATELRPDYAEAHLNLGLKMAEREQFEEALESISEAVRLAPDHPAARQGLAMVLTRLDRPLEAVPHFETIVRDQPASVDARLNLGIALAEAGRREEALAHFDRAVEIDPDSSRAHYNRGRALNDLGRTPDARRALETAIKLNRSHAPSLRLLGSIERASRNDGRAVELLRRAAALEPGDPIVHYELGMAVAQAGVPRDAIPHWEKTLSLDPRHQDATYNLAQALQHVDPGRSRAYLERFAKLKAEAQDTDRAGTLWNFALAEADKKRWDRAFDLFRQALEACGSCPARGQIHKNFGLVYGHSGDYANAAEQLSRALELEPEDEEIRRALSIVESSGTP